MPKDFKLRLIIGFAAVYLIWGSTYLAIRFAVETIPPFMMASMRFLVSGLVLYAVMRLGGTAAPDRSHWRPAVILGILMPVGGTGLVSWAETVVPSGLTALLVAAAPLWIVLADWVRPGGTRPTLMVVTGLVMGFAGITLLINPADIGGYNEVHKFGALVVVIATVSWAAGSVYSRHAPQPTSKTLGVSMQMISGGIGLLMVSLLMGEFSGFGASAVSAKSWLALGYQIILGSTAFVVYVWLLSASTPAKAATYAYVNPVVALALGSVAAGEALSGWTVACAAVVVVAVVIIISARGRVELQPTSIESCEAIPCVKTPYTVKESSQ